jgi:hypothetical protein
MNYVLEQIEKIAAQTEYLTRAFDAVTRIDDGENPECGSPGNDTGAAKAQAIGEMAKSREATNQRLLQIYEKMYDDLKPVRPARPKSEFDVAIIGSLIQAASELTPIEKAQFFKEQMNKVL